MRVVVFLIIALALLWHGNVFSQQASPADSQWQAIAGQHYHAINPDALPAQSSPLNPEQQIISFYFWSGSESCYQLDQALQSWQEQYPQIQIDKIPLVKRPGWRLLAKAWLVAKTMDDEQSFLDALYQKIHGEKEAIDNYLSLEQFIISRGLDPIDFKAQFNSLSTNQQLYALQLQADNLSIAGVPTVIINNHWYTDASTGISSAQLITIIEQLIDKDAVDKL